MVEQALAAAKAGPFIENDCVLGARASPRAPDGGSARAAASGSSPVPTWQASRPSCARTRLIAVLAQMGSYVPARSATIGAVDRLFSRVGASDDLARGRSTFMVEMVETAAILNQASRPLARHPGRDRPRHGDLRRPVDRLGDGRVPARGARRARAVCHPLPRADGARPPPRRRRQRDDGRARVARRDRVPAQGEARRRRPLVWHPGCEARRPARQPCSAARARCWRCSKSPTAGRARATAPSTSCPCLR